jgi:hypothetical protein
MLWTIITANFSKIGVFLLGLATAIMFKKNKSLSLENQQLKQGAEAATQRIEIQSKVLDAVQNTKDSDVDGNIKRMRENNL